MSEVTRLRDALATISRVAYDATHATRGDGHGPRGGGREEPADEEADEREDEGAAALVTCTPKSLPARLLLDAAETARNINPMNAPLTNVPALDEDVGRALGELLDPMRIAVLTSRYWGPAPRRLAVSFMESTPADLRNRILGHLNAWSDRGGISFTYTQGIGDVRISRGPGGYWSYLGTDILRIPRNRPTMNLDAFTMQTPEREYRRVVRHEAGHTLGFPHEHMRRELVARIDRQKAYDYFWRTQRWDRATVDAQVLTALDQRSIYGTPADQTSIMCYQLPGSITRNGRPIEGGLDINASDYAFVARIYPRPAGTSGRNRVRYQASVEPEPATELAQDDWDPSEDVEPVVA